MSATEVDFSPSPDGNDTVDTIDCDNEIIPRLVIAIDFGTYACGFVWQWRRDYDNTNCIESIKVPTIWSSEGFCTRKTPSCILLKPDRSIADFGYKADFNFSKYESISERKRPKDWKDWYFFRHFKLRLYGGEKMTVDTPLEAANNKHLPIVEVLSKIIAYLKNEAINTLKKEDGVVYPEEETKWVITVPAIWNDPAKHVMHEAAVMAGIMGKNITIALEPECAAVYITKLPLDKMDIASNIDETTNIAAPGKTLMVIDMGGRTVNITTVKINENKTMQQVYKSCGGPWGGMKVNEKFEMFLGYLIGEETMRTFVQKHAMDFRDLRMDFESRKREVKEDSEEQIPIILPKSLRQLWERAEDKDIDDILESKEELFGSIEFMSGRLFLDAAIIRKFFQETVDGLQRFIEEEVFCWHSKITVNSLILVGGFAESSYVVNLLRERLKWRNIPVVRPHQPELAFLYGAVLFGHNEQIISRVKRHAYDVAVTTDFDFAMNSNNTTLEKRNEDKDSKIETLVEIGNKYKNPKMETLEKLCKYKDSKIEMLVKRNEVKDSKIEILEKRIEDKDFKIETLMKWNKDKDSKIKTLQKINDAKDIKINTLQKINKDNDSKIESLEKRCKDKDSKIEMLKKRNEDKTSKTEILEETNEAKVSITETLQKINKDKDSKIETPEKRSEDKYSKTETLEKRIEAADMRSMESTTEMANIMETNVSEGHVNVFERFSKLYDEDWAKLLKWLKQTSSAPELEVIHSLTDLMRNGYRECLQFSDVQIRQFLLLDESQDIPMFVNNPEFYALRKTYAQTKTARIKVERVVLEKILPANEKSTFYVWDKSQETKQQLQDFLCKFLDCCWLMIVSVPPISLNFNVDGKQFCKEHFRMEKLSSTNQVQPHNTYTCKKPVEDKTKENGTVYEVVWPCVCLQDGSAFYQKGVVVTKGIVGKEMSENTECSCLSIENCDRRAPLNANALQENTTAEKAISTGNRKVKPTGRSKPRNKTPN